MSWELTNEGVALAPLRHWIEREPKEEILLAPHERDGGGKNLTRQTSLRKTAVAYGIAQLLRQTSRSNCNSALPQASLDGTSRSLCNSALPQASLDGRCSIDNFVVRIKARGRRSHLTWRDIEGVDMLSPKLSVNLVEPFYLRLENDDDEMGGCYVEAEFPSIPEADREVVCLDQCEEDDRCHSFGVLLYELFFSCSPITARVDAADDGGGMELESEIDDASLVEHVRKKIQLVDLRVACVPEIRSHTVVIREKTFPALFKGGNPDSGEGFPSSLSLVIHDLLDCGVDDHPKNAYQSLDAVINDLHLLLLDPGRFLFNHEPTYNNDGRTQLSFRDHKVYGREDEVSLITDAFCRVSGGGRESLFIGGFSGSGKSRLVNGLTARVDVAGGYVLTLKFDQMSQEKSILGIVAMFNDLCLLIKEKSSLQDLSALVNNLGLVFGSDWSTLAGLLPNVNVLVPQLERLTDNREETDNQMNVRSICFTLQRFIRVVSSPQHPVVFFFDDLQWCEMSALTVVESLLCDTIGTPCLFFVGTYRSNEVAEDNEIILLAQRLKCFGVPTTMLSLEGLNPRDLNTMVSDALFMFPRKTEPLSDIIHQKTKGNPFFVLSFMRSLVDGGFLEYSIKTRRWVWNEDDVSSLDITGNVLYIVSSKMCGLSSSIQAALKVAACFGIKIRESVVEALCTHSDHSDIHNQLDQAVKEGFMIKGDASEFKFVHDKVREAAYCLIPEKDKDQYHYRLGMSLYNMSKDNSADDILFYIVDQIKHGFANLFNESLELRINIAKLFESSGSKAAASSDHVASCSYFTYALSLLPPDHWKSHYDLSVQFSLRLAKSCYSCGDLEKAQLILQEMTFQCHSIEDKAPAHALLAKIFLDRKSYMDAYTLGREVLSQLGEEIPASLYPFQIPLLIARTLSMTKKLSEDDLLEMKEMDERLSIIVKFYNIMTKASYLVKPDMTAFFTSRVVQLTMKNGLCNHSILGFVQFAVILCAPKIAKMGGSIALGSRIGKAAMLCSPKRYVNSESNPNLQFVYYTHVAFYTEPLQTCADMLRQGFDASMSIGESGTAFFNSMIHVRTAMLVGERLPALLERVDYYLGLTNTFQNEMAKLTLAVNRETISVLIAEGGSFGSTPDTIDVPVDMESSTHLLAGIYFHRATQAYWQSRGERCQHFIKKFTTLETFDNCRHLFVAFISGMNSFQLLRQKKDGGKNRFVGSMPTVLNIISKAIKVLKDAALHSSWNFQNKVHLLQAELFSFHNKINEAQSSYAEAITCARSSGFIHEQGLACECAGYHCKKIGDLRGAWTFFDRAKHCYTEWGSQMKVDSITLQLRSLSD